MCRIYSNTDPADYEPVARSVRIHGMVTSIKLERRFWSILEEMARGEGSTVPQFVTVLHDEVLESRGEVTNFASFLRVTCTTYLALRLRQPVAAAS
ncbi:MAG: ribbon-helix-helix domain-containing protein [Pseudomonadota bacterium]